MPSKMRMMRKMINSEQTGHADIPLNSMKKFEDQKQPMAPAKTDNSSNNSFNNNPTVRVCADCNTTKTPLWRSGPRGPKVYFLYDCRLRFHVDIVKNIFFSFLFNFYNYMRWYALDWSWTLLLEGKEVLFDLRVHYQCCLAITIAVQLSSRVRKRLWRDN